VSVSWVGACGAGVGFVEAKSMCPAVIYTKVFFDKIFEIFCRWLPYVFVKISSYVIRNTRMFAHTSIIL